MTADEFRKNGQLVADWRAVLAMPITRTVFAVADDDAPVRRVIKSDITSTYASVRLGHQAGWAELVTLLTKGLLLSPIEAEQLEQTFEPEPDPEPDPD